MIGDSANTNVTGAGNRTPKKIVMSYTQRNAQKVGKLQRGRDMEEIEIRVIEKEGEAKPEVVIERIAEVMIGVGSPVKMGKEINPQKSRRWTEMDVLEMKMTLAKRERN